MKYEEDQTVSSHKHRFDDLAGVELVEVPRLSWCSWFFRRPYHRRPIPHEAGEPAALPGHKRVTPGQGPAGSRAAPVERLHPASTVQIRRCGRDRVACAVNAPVRHHEVHAAVASLVLQVPNEPVGPGMVERHDRQPLVRVPGSDQSRARASEPSVAVVEQDGTVGVHSGKANAEFHLRSPWS
jgi:hypothetical protein